MAAQRGQAAVEAVGVALALAVIGGVAASTAAERLAGETRVGAALAAAATAPPPGGPLAGAGARADVDVAGLLVPPSRPGAYGAVAIAEQLLGLGVREEPPGSDGGPMVFPITDGNREPWCADFVSYVFLRAGAPFTGGLSGGWRIPGALALRAWFAERGRWTPRARAHPEPGDVVYFSWDHVGIVRRVAGGVLETIEGNASHAVRLRAYPDWRVDARIDGFGRR